MTINKDLIIGKIVECTNCISCTSEKFFVTRVIVKNNSLLNKTFVYFYGVSLINNSHESLIFFLEEKDYETFIMYKSGTYADISIKILID